MKDIFIFLNRIKTTNFEVFFLNMNVYFKKSLFNKIINIINCICQIYELYNNILIEVYELYLFY